MKNLLVLISTIAMVIVLAACSAPSKVVGTHGVPFVIADHYFVKNDVNTLPEGKITTQTEFFSKFGQAAVMGGLPTPINFKKQFVVAVCVPETNYDTSILPVALKHDGKNLIFTYHINKGEKKGYSIQPMLLIVVDKKYEAPLKMQKQ